MSNQWVDRLSDEFEWQDLEPGPETVVDEAHGNGIETIDDLTGYMNDAPNHCASGYAKWRWQWNNRISYGL